MSAADGNEEIELRLLSCLMFGAWELNQAISAGLEEVAFAYGKCARIFRAITIAAAETGQTDPVATWRAMSGLNGVSETTLPELSNIAGMEPTTVRLSRYTEDVVALWKQRKVVAALRAATEAAGLPAGSWPEVWERVSPHLTAVEAAGHSSKLRTVEVMRSEAKALINAPQVGSMPGPFPSWDARSKPLRAGQLAILAARTGVGKTALALQYAGAVLKAGKVAAFFSLEMSGAELLNRLASQAASPQTSEQETLAQLDHLPIQNLRLYENGTHSHLSQIEATTRVLTVAGNLGIVVVDYLALVKPPPGTGREHREAQVAALSRAFKLLAGSLPCPLLVLAQLNREPEKDGRRPRLSDLRDSGAIEQDADAVWFLWEKPPEGPKVSDNGDRDRIEVHLIQAKRRNGQPNVYTRLSFHRPSVTFTPIFDEKPTNKTICGRAVARAGARTASPQDESPEDHTFL